MCLNRKELLIRYSSVDHIQVEDMEGIIMAPGSEAVALESILDRALPPIYLCCSTFSAKSELGSICCQRMEDGRCCESKLLGTKQEGGG